MAGREQDKPQRGGQQPNVGKPGEKSPEDQERHANPAREGDIGKGDVGTGQTPGRQQQGQTPGRQQQGQTPERSGGQQERGKSGTNRD